MKTRFLIITFILVASVLSAQDSIVSAFTKSYTFETSLQYSQAINEIQKVYLKDSYSMNIRLGWLHYKNKDYIKSQTFYQKAIDLQPKSIEARFGLAYPLVELGNWQDAVDNYLKIVEISPYESTANYRLSYIYYHYLKDNDMALKHINKVVEVYPFDFDANYQLAVIQVSKGNIIEARNAILIALQYDPYSAEAKIIYDTVK